MTTPSTVASTASRSSTAQRCTWPPRTTRLRDRAGTGKVLWHLHVGTSVARSVFDSAPTLSGGCGDIDPLGITGTPVIDAATDEIFVAEETELAGQKGWQGIRHWLVAISLRSHQVLWHRDIDPPFANNPAHYFIPAEQQRPAITLANGRLYVGFGGLDGDCGQYHGYLVDLPVTGEGPLESYQVPTQREGRSGRRTGPRCRHKATCTSPRATGAPTQLQTSTRATRSSSFRRRCSGSATGHRAIGSSSTARTRPRIGRADQRAGDFTSVRRREALPER